MVTAIEKSIYELAEIERRLRLAEAETARLVARTRTDPDSATAATPRRRRVPPGRDFLGAALGRLAALAYDSRPILHSR